MMKKYVLSFLLLAVASMALAQEKVSVKVWKGGNATTIEQIDSITFPNTMQEPACVDLGLSVKWASCNLGAETPEAYGNYYAWGETSTKEYYNWDKYKYCTPLTMAMSKYNSTDKKTILEAEDDAATVLLGNNWRIPTADEMKELVENVLGNGWKTKRIETMVIGLQDQMAIVSSCLPLVVSMTTFHMQ